MVPASLSAGFQSLPLPLTIKLGPSGADSQVGGFVYTLGPCGSLQWTLLLLPQPPRVFSIRGLRLYFPGLKPWVVWSVARSASRHLAISPLCPSCPSLPLLLVWMNVSSLSPWLLDFHTVHFSVSSGCFLFLNCCPSFGCVRRHSVSTYTSILTGSPSCLVF